MSGRRSFNDLKAKSYKRVGNSTVVGAEKLNVSWWNLPCGRGSVIAVRKISPFRPNHSTRKPIGWLLKKVLQ